MRRLVSVAIVTAVLTAVIVPAAAQQDATRIPLADLDPLPAAADLDLPDEVRSVRDQVLGPEWSDPTHVRLWWTGVSSFVISIGGHVLLFDAWEIIGAVNDYLPIGREELAALAPEAVLVGHGHFDHAGDLGYVAGRSGALVVGSDEICSVAVAGALREEVGTGFACAITGTMDSPPMGTAQQVTLFADLPPVTILQHIHSATAAPSEDNELDPFVPIMDVDPYLEHLADDPEELVRFVGQQQESDQGGTWMYHLAIGDFTLLVGDSAGPIFDLPDVVAALGAFPGCVDVMANAILGFDQPVSGLQDPALYVAAVRPHVFLPTHADAWAPVISAGQAQYGDKLAEALAEEGVDPEVDLLLDPDDYLVPRAYRVDDPRWAEPVAGTRCAAAAPTPTPTPAPTPSPTAEPTPDPEPTTPLPVTGGGAAVVAALAAGAAVLSRRRSGRR